MKYVTEVLPRWKLSLVLTKKQSLTGGPVYISVQSVIRLGDANAPISIGISHNGGGEAASDKKQQRRLRERKRHRKQTTKARNKRIKRKSRKFRTSLKQYGEITNWFNSAIEFFFGRLLNDYYIKISRCCSKSGGCRFYLRFV